MRVETNLPDGTFPMRMKEDRWLQQHWLPCTSPGPVSALAAVCLAQTRWTLTGIGSGMTAPASIDCENHPGGLEGLGRRRHIHAWLVPFQNERNDVRVRKKNCFDLGGGIPTYS